MNRKKLVRLLLGFAVTLFFVYLISRQIRAEDFIAAARSAQPGGVLLALLAFVAGFACRTARWHAMLRTDNPELRWTRSCGPFVASFAVNNLLPLRAGDLLRIVGFNRRIGVAAGPVAASMFVERLLDLMMLLAMLGLALSLFDLQLNQLARISSSGLLLLAAGILLVLAAPQLVAGLVQLVFGGMAKVAPGLVARLRPPVEQALSTLLRLSSGTTLLRLLAWSVTAWFFEGLMFWLAARALPAIDMAHAGWLAFPIATLSTLVPSTPGYVGTFDYFASQAMQILGNTPNASAVYAIVVHLLLWLPPTLVGAIYLLIAPPDRLAAQH